MRREFFLGATGWALVLAAGTAGCDRGDCFSPRITYQGERSGPVIFRGWVGDRSMPDQMLAHWTPSMPQASDGDFEICGSGGSGSREWTFEAFIDVNGNCGTGPGESIMECEAEPGDPYGMRTGIVSGTVVDISLAD